jgi:hypothetical protein
MNETKSQLTDRLRREGRWAEASNAREHERERLRATGMDRKQANSEAWSLMAAQYPPLTADEIEWGDTVFWMMVAKFPPECECLNTEAEPQFSDLVWPFCYLNAYRDRIAKNDRFGASAVLVEMLADAPSDRAARFSIQAFVDPVSFLAEVSDTFTKAIERLDTANAEQVYAAEIRSYIARVPSLSDALGRSGRLIAVLP